MAAFKIPSLLDFEKRTRGRDSAEARNMRKPSKPERRRFPPDCETPPPSRAVPGIAEPPTPARSAGAGSPGILWSHGNRDTGNSRNWRREKNRTTGDRAFRCHMIGHNTGLTGAIRANGKESHDLTI